MSQYRNKTMIWMGAKVTGSILATIILLNVSHAATIVLNTGREIQGHIISSTSKTIWYEVACGKLGVSKESVREIRDGDQVMSMDFVDLPSTTGAACHQIEKDRVAKAQLIEKDPVPIMKGKRAFIPLKKQGDRYIVTLKINGQKAQMVLDTGASTIVISKALADRLKIDLEKGKPGTSFVADGRELSGRVISLNEVNLDVVVLKNVDAWVFDEEQTQDLDGLFGMSFLKKFVFSIDTVKNELILEKR